MPLLGFAFSKLRPPKTWSGRCLKTPVSDDPSKSNIVNVPKHCWNLHHSTFTLFIHHFQINWVGKILCYWHGICWDCFSTHWLPMKSSLFLRETIQHNQFRFNYLRNKKLFPYFFLHFLDIDLILNILEIMMTLIDFVISRLRTLKTWLGLCLKFPVSDDTSTGNIVNVPKHCWNLHHSIFMIIIDHCPVNSVGKSICFWHAKSWDCLLRHWLPMKSILFLRETI